MMDKLYKQNDGLVINTDYEEENGEMVEFSIVFNIDEERIFYLSHTAHEIFKLAIKPVSEDRILAFFTEEYDIGERERDLVCQAINDLVEKNILLIV